MSMSSRARPSVEAAAPIDIGSYNPAALGLHVVSGGSVRASINGAPEAGGSEQRHPSVLSRPNNALPPEEQLYIVSNIRYLLVGFIQMFLIWLLYTFTAYQIGVPWQLFLKLRSEEACTPSAAHACLTAAAAHAVHACPASTTCVPTCL